MLYRSLIRPGRLEEHIYMGHPDAIQVLVDYYTSITTTIITTTITIIISSYA
jgi:hypothetical protein